MAITISSLLPARASTGVLLTSTLSFTLTSDADDIDSFSFKINGVETDITPTSIPNPSIDFLRSLADLEYGQSYTCSIEATAGNTTFLDIFTFVIEEGIFKNTNPSEYSYHQMTQELANFLPEETKARYDRFSVFQQFMNRFGGPTEELENSLFKQLSAYFVQTTNLRDLATLYKIELPGNFLFGTVLLDDGTTLYKPPALFGQIDIHKFELDPAYSNDLYSFYYSKLPDRYSVSTKAFGSSEIYPLSSITKDIITLDFDLLRPGGFIIELVDCNSFATIRDNTIVDLLSLRIKGTSTFDKPIEEVISFIENGTSYSKKNWNTIDSIEFQNLPEGFNGSFRLDHFPASNILLNDFFKYSDLETSNFISWQLDTGPFGTLLQSWKDPTLDVLDKLRDSSKILVRETELYDIDNITPLSLIDFAIDEYGPFIFGIDSDYLYIFNKIDEYPKGLSNLTKATKDPLTILEIQLDELRREALGKSVSFRAAQMILTKKAISYRFKILKPDGNIFYITPTGTETVDSNFNLVSNNVSNFKSTQVTYLMTMPGDYYLTLETRYQDGSIDRDVQLLRVPKKSALIKYKLAKFLTELPSKLFFDFDQELKIIDATNNLHILSFHRDNLLIDYEDKILYLNENYDKVIIDE